MSNGGASTARSPSPPHYTSIVPLNSTVAVQPDSASSYTLATIPVSRPESPNSSLGSERAPLLDTTSISSSSYGATAPRSAGVNGSSRRILLNAAMKMAVLFIVSTAVLGGILWLALPTLDEDDRPRLHVPKSFAQLQDLNMLLKKYRDIYPYRIVICYVITYFFLQAFSLPGSMYLSILGGAVWGIPRALPLACSCVATGATLCYLISAALGPALLAVPKWKARLDTWTARIAAHRENLLSYLIVLRIAPFPPHWVVNVLAPHLGVGIVPFWISTFLGIVGVTVIHTTIGRGLDEMTSPADFKLISWRNALGLSAVVAGALMPVGLRYLFKRRAGIALGEDDEDIEDGLGDEDGEGDRVLAQGPRVGAHKGKRRGMSGTQLILLSDSEGEEDMEEDLLDEEEDEILLAGPVLAPTPKGKNTDNGQDKGWISSQGQD